MKTLKTFAKYDESKRRTEPIGTSEGPRWITPTEAVSIRSPHTFRTLRGGYIWAETKYAPIMGGQPVPHCARVFRAVEYAGVLVMTIKDSGIDTISIIPSVFDFQQATEKYAADPRWALAGMA